MTFLPYVAILAGLAALIWSADRFVLGAASLAQRLGMPSLLIGMLVIGFGTSAPEMIVSAIASLQGNPGLALGNAYGSNIANIALILGVTALISPIMVNSSVVRRELPVLGAVTVLSVALLWDLELSRLDGIVLLAAFAGLVAWSIREARMSRGDALAVETEADMDIRPLSRNAAIGWTVGGLLLLIVSSRALVWGAVELARSFGISDLMIGLTVVAIGTSLPELASSIAALRRKEHDLALGNVVGSNLFNTLAVVGISGVIMPFAAPSEILTRDLPVMSALTFALVVMCYGFGRRGRVNRIEGCLLLAAFALYTGHLVTGVGEDQSMAGASG